MSETCSMCCAVCRILCYNLYKAVCCVKESKPTPEFRCICIGLTKAGKSSLLSIMTKENVNINIDLQPTIGFNIKAVHMSDCILNVKEIGGSENVRPYWPRYYEDSVGVIFVIDSSADVDSFETSKNELHTAMQHPELKGLPLLLLGTHQDCVNARDTNQLTEELELASLCHENFLIVQPCSLKDRESINHGFTRFSQLLLQSSVTNYQYQVPAGGNSAL